MQLSSRVNQVSLSAALMADPIEKKSKAECRSVGLVRQLPDRACRLGEGGSEAR